MNTLAAVAIAPFGVGDELASDAAEAIRVIRDSGPPHRTTSMFTEIEARGRSRRPSYATRIHPRRPGIRTEVILVPTSVRDTPTPRTPSCREKVEEPSMSRGLSTTFHS